MVSIVCIHCVISYKPIGSFSQKKVPQALYHNRGNNWFRIFFRDQLMLIFIFTTFNVYISTIWLRAVGPRIIWLAN